tara:strand:+ start:2595 stop:3560 length:966 start_codon:yes stop_codon:yes gene_type:complete
MSILVTGCAGFIGYNTTKELLKKNKKVIGIDNLNNYYDLDLKKNRLNLLNKDKNFFFFKIDVTNKKKLSNLIKKERIKYIIHLAAQAGVRYSINTPDEYFESNIIGFYYILNLSVKYKIKHLIFSSSSSVYGNNKKTPYNEESNSDFPISFYAATKKSNEVMAHSYSNIYKLPITILRFFTVFGPMGRPDMAIYKFTKNIKENKNLNLYNNGTNVRDFTYVDRITKIITKILYNKPTNKVPYKIYNIGSGYKIKIMSLVKILEKLIGKKSKIVKKPQNKGDVSATHADISKISKKIKLNKQNLKNLENDLKKYLDWYDNYY